MSGDPEQEYLADGLTEDIITALSLWRSFPVIARNSTFFYKGQSPDVRKIASDLGARYVLEGSVRRSGNRVRVTGQLIDAETGHHVWAERYDRELDDIFALQDEMAHRIAAIIEPAIAIAEQKRAATRKPNDLDAWDCCLRGYAHIYHPSKEGNELARKMFNRAIEIDPNYANAWTGLAYTYARDVRFGWFDNRDQSIELIFEAARRAIALDESDSDAHTMLARGYNFRREPEPAIASGRRAVEINPHNAPANIILGATLSLSAGRYDDGIPWIESALELNPLDPRNYMFMTHLAVAHLCAGHHQASVDLVREATRRQPDFIESHVALASALGHLGQKEEAHRVIAGFEDSALDYVEGRPNWAQKTKDCVLDGLRKAGLLE
jgi:adenylate cyclase